MDKPTAEQFREMLSEALEDPRKPEIQMKVLDDVFTQGAAMFPDVVDKGLAQIYEQLSGMGQRDPFYEQYAQENPKMETLRNRDVFNAVMRRDPADRTEDFIVGLTTGSIDPVLRIGLSINPQVADFSDFGTADEPGILDLPGYIKLHETARDRDVGISVTGVKGGEGREQQALIIIDLSKNYEQGQLMPGLNYPVLTQPEEEAAQPAPQARQSVRGKRIKHYTIQ